MAGRNLHELLRFGGRAFGEIVLEGEDRPTRLCRKCQEPMSAHSATWWEAQARRETRLITSLRRAGAKAQRSVDEAIRQFGLQRRTIMTLQGKLSARQEDLKALGQTVENLKATNKELQLRLELERQRSLEALTKVEDERIRRPAAETTTSNRSPEGRPQHKPRAREPAKSAAKAHRTTRRNKAKNKFYPVEVAPFPATFVRGGLPGHGKRR